MKKEDSNFIVHHRMHHHYPIQPMDIDAEQYFCSFRYLEKGLSATWIIQFCQEQCSWKPFTLKELGKFYHESMPKNKRFSFDGLDTGGLIVLKDGKYHVTHRFITMCFLASPKKPK